MPVYNKSGFIAHLFQGKMLDLYFIPGCAAARPEQPLLSSLGVCDADKLLSPKFASVSCIMAGLSKLK